MKDLTHFKKLIEAEKEVDYANLQQLTVTNSDGDVEVHTAKSGKTVEEADAENDEDTYKSKVETTKKEDKPKSKKEIDKSKEKDDKSDSDDSDDSEESE